MWLTIDAGNTRVKTGLFNQTQLQEVRYWTKEQEKEIHSYSLEKEVRHVIVATVIDGFSIKWESPIASFLLSEKTPLPITNHYQQPDKLGKDRLAGILGAWHLFPKRNTLVVDIGTCIKYDFINESGEYKGGSISPGLRMRLRAMHHFTSRLPQLDLVDNYDIAGLNTANSMMTGTIQGVIGEIRHFVSLYKARSDDLSVILTGGDARFLSLHLESNFHLEPDLVLLGLAAVLKYNIDYEASNNM